MASVAKRRKALTSLTQSKRERGRTMLKRVTDMGVMRQVVPSTTAADEVDMASGFGQKLRELRERAHLTQTACAKAMGISQTGYSNYENEKRYQTHPIPADKAMQLVTLLSGKGTPPIQPNEVLDITELRGIQNILGGVSDRPVRASVPHELGEVVHRPNTIKVRYTIEKGVYRDADAIDFAQQSAGRSGAPVLPLRHYPDDQQWGCLVVDGSGQRIGLPKHTLLHCVDAAVLSPDQLPEGSIVVALRRRDSLAEVILCVVVGYHGRTMQLKDASTDAPVEAEVLGAAIYRYGPVAQA